MCEFDSGEVCSKITHGKPRYDVLFYYNIVLRYVWFGLMY